jgi:hypothetical protein
MLSRYARQLAPLLIGVIATVSGLWAAQCSRADACRDAGGRWDAAARACEGAPSDPGAIPYAIGLAVGVVLLVVLWRTYTFFALRAAARGRPPSGAA